MTTKQHSQTSLGVELAEAVRQALMPIPRLRLEGVVDSSGAGAAHWYTEGSLARRGNQWVLSFTLADRLGPSHTRTYATSEPLPYVLADSVAQEIVDLLFPELELRRWMGTTPLVAIGEYIQGLLAFQKDHWNTADNRFAAAIEIDSSFALARWWQVNAQKLGRRSSDLGSLQRIFSKDEKAFSPLDSLLITARLEPNLEARFQLYDEAVEEYGSRYYAALFRGVELFQRGALAGHALNEALVALGEARSIDPQVGWAHNQLIWAYIRLGRKAEAKDALRQRREITTDASPGDPDILTLFEWAYLERFEPEKAAVFLDSVLRNPDSPLLRDVGTMLRLASSLDLPGIQIKLGSLMARDPTSDAQVQANGNTARGLAFIMTGRPVTGVHLLDLASNMWATSGQRFLAEEMRLMLPAFDIRIPTDEIERARSRIESFLDDAALGTRAAWALANDARHRGDANAAREWRRRVTSEAQRGPYYLPLDTVLLALEDADGGDFRGALERSRPLLEIDSTGRGSDPFARALLYWHRAKWWEALGDTASAEREWLWYENVDFGPWPKGVLQPAEIDWMLSTYARLNRARAQLSLPNRDAEACVHLRRVVELWANAEPDILPRKQRADSLIADRCAA